jgi:hypothetical protein
LKKGRRKIMAMRTRKNKYKNKKVEIDGIVFDSKKEARRYQELLLLERNGIIKDIQRQVKFVLIPAQREPDSIGARGGVHKGKVLENECSYIADFVYFDNIANEVVVEDTKGFRTKDYVIKRKLMLKIHGIKITEV